MKYMSKEIMSPVFRLSFPKLFDGELNGKGSLIYSCTALWCFKNFTELDVKRWHELMDLLNESSLICFRSSYEIESKKRKMGLLKYDPNSNKARGMDDGDMYSTLTSQDAPLIVDRENRGIGRSFGNENLVYPGSWFRAIILCYLFKFNGQEGLSLGLRDMQKVADGPRLDRRELDPNRVCTSFGEKIEQQWIDKQDQYNQSNQNNQNNQSNQNNQYDQYDQNNQNNQFDQYDQQRNF